MNLLKPKPYASIKDFFILSVSSAPLRAVHKKTDLDKKVREIKNEPPSLREASANAKRLEEKK